MTRDKVGEVTRIIIVGLVIVAAIGGFVALVLSERDVNSYIYLLAMMGIPTLATVLGARTAARAQVAAEAAQKAIHETQSTVQATQSTVQQVETLVNGNTTRLMDELTEYRSRYGTLPKRERNGNG